MHLRNRSPTMANDGRTPFDLYYHIKPNVSYIRPFGCITKVTLPSENLGKLDDRVVMGYLVGYMHEGDYRVWIPKMGLKEARDVTFYEDNAPLKPENGATVDSLAQPWPINEPPTASTSSHVSQPILPTPATTISDNVEPHREKLTRFLSGSTGMAHICSSGLAHPSSC